ncbi:MAG TPA: twin-arginine translocation signal domain-containing protein [Candidatus Acidoferrum sp.]|nr:twin-arginine translocation signal domain-containing protein [Candidatus Acidoferrum sp.]
MKKDGNVFMSGTSRRSFLKKGTVAASAATVGVGLLTDKTFAFERDNDDDDAPITRGDIAILRFLQALELVEDDLWRQYAELGGTVDTEFTGLTTPNGPYTNSLLKLDGDMPQYIHDNTDDEISHQRFLGNYLASKGVKSADLSPFRVLPSSQADGAVKTAKRLTNLTQLTIDTSFWTRYRSITNPDFDPKATFDQAVKGLNVGLHTAIPRTNADTTGDPNLIDAIAFTAGFHFAFIEVGGTSLYPTLAQKVTNLEVLRILLSIGPSEAMHFQTWQDKAGNANAGNPDLTVTDPINGFPVTFTDLHVATGESADEITNAGKVLQANLIMPEPTHFLNPDFGPVAIVRPTSTKLNGAVAAVTGLANDNLFLDPKTGQNTGIVARLLELAEEADEARRQF